MLEGELGGESTRGGERGAAEGFEEFEESVCPETNDDVVFDGDGAEGGRNSGPEGYFEEVVNVLSEAGMEKRSQIEYYYQIGRDLTFYDRLSVASISPSPSPAPLPHPPLPLV